MECDLRYPSDGSESDWLNRRDQRYSDCDRYMELYNAGGRQWCKDCKPGAIYYNIFWFNHNYGSACRWYRDGRLQSDAVSVRRSVTVYVGSYSGSTSWRSQF